MAIAYIPPGVTVEELSSPGINPTPTVPATVCLVGLARGYEIKTALATLGIADSSVTITIPQGGVFQQVSGGQKFITSVDAIDPRKGTGADPGGYVEGVSADFTAVVAGDFQSVTITPVAASILDTAGGVIKVTYRFLPDNYFEPIRLDTVGAVESRFGQSYDTTGTSIETTLSYAAGLALANGAGTVICQPLFKLTTPGNHASVKLQPDSTQAADPDNWSDTFYNLRTFEDINILVPVVGQHTGIADADQLEIFENLAAHQKFMLDQGEYVIAILGEDATTSASTAQMATLRTHAETLADLYGGVVAQSTVLISPATFYRGLPTDNSQFIAVGGQYVAAAVAGMVASRAVTQPITRKAIAGINAVGEQRTRFDKDADAASGLLVVEGKGRAVQVRHGITLDSSSVATRELSVVRAKQNLIETVRSALDGSLPIISDGSAELTIQTIVIGILEQLRQRSEIVSYSNVESRILQSDPTSAEVRFSYRPVFPINYISIVFSLDLTQGTTVITTTENNV